MGPAKCARYLTSPCCLNAHEGCSTRNAAPAQPAGTDGIHGGRFEARNDADQIAEQDENEERAEERQIFVSVVADIVLGLAVQKIIDHFEDMLQLCRAGPRTGAAAERRTATMMMSGHQDLHGDEVGPGTRGVFSVHANHREHSDCPTPAR